VAPFSKSKITGATQSCENTSIAEPKSVTAAQPAVGIVPAATAGGTQSFSGYEWRSGII
jgi:hypothetical protein